ncbi:MAG: aldo/keto reductase [Candidatus Cloacimonetes bacterium]|nr:aldo/keto reductase [Candidatus Cloacimonadota bacterium]
MKYRKLGKTDILVSEIGFGCTYFRETGEQMLSRMIDIGIDAGINFLDLCLSRPDDRDVVGRVLEGRRYKMIIQGHLGLSIENGQEARTQDLHKSKAHMEDLLSRLKTDYIDIAMLHCIDQIDEYNAAVQSGLIDYMLQQKKKGVFKALGFSSHEADVASEMVRSGNFDVVMFSISPLFDLLFNDMERFFTMSDDDAYPRDLNIDPKRAAFYSLCVEKGVGISVMKALAAGSLVDPLGSPFDQTMTVPQCIHYALNRPAVSSVFIGMKNEKQLEDALSYYQATPSELDYSGILNSVTGEIAKKCLYCNHCLPCTAQIDIGRVTRLLDDATIRGINSEMMENYANLTVKASACTECGLCVPRCPFGIDIVANMKKANEIYSSSISVANESLS